MTAFDWSVLPAAVAKELARQLRLPSSDPTRELAAAYPDVPDPEFVRRTWPVLRDRWVARTPQVRARVVAALRARGLGDVAISGVSAAAQRDYLNSCRNSAGLRTAVAAALRPGSVRTMPDVPATGPATSPVTSPAGGLASSPASGPVSVATALDLGSKVEAAWADFRTRLLGLLRAGRDGDRVVIELDPTADGSETSAAYYVRWTVDGAAADGPVLHVEAVSNHGLPSSRRLGSAQLSGLVALGWDVPDDTDGSSNFHVTVPANAAEQVADLVTQTLRDIYGAPHPAFLTAAGANGDAAVDLGPLHLRARRATAPLGSAAVGTEPGGTERAGAVAEGATAATNASSEPEQDIEEVARFTLARGLGVDVEHLRRDDDGDYPIRSGSAMVFVRVFPEQGIVSVFSPVLVDVTDTDALRRRLIDLQESIPFVKFVVEEGIVTAAVHLMGNPLHPDHLDRVILLMTTLCDHLDDELQGDFGGRTFFGQAVAAPPPAPDEAATGGYL